MASVGRVVIKDGRRGTQQIAVQGRQRYSSSSGGSQFYGFIPPAVLLNFSLMSLFKKDDDTPEDKLVMTIKRAILSIQKEEHEKAERILHMALRMAQDMNSKDGITYVFDAMANLAMERGEFEKAEKLFVDVMKRLFGDGAEENDMRLLHISAKLAHMAEQSGQLEKAKQGFEWVIIKLEERMKAAQDDENVKELWGMTKNWYAQALMQMNSMKDAKKAFEEAHKAYLEIHGKLSEEGLLLLNNLGVVCTNVSLTVLWNASVTNPSPLVHSWASTMSRRSI